VLFGIERGNCVQHRVDRIVLPKGIAHPAR
jgi:hypothetical protein